MINTFGNSIRIYVTTSNKEMCVCAIDWIYSDIIYTLPQCYTTSISFMSFVLDMMK